MTDAEIINQAYAGQLQALFSTLVVSMGSGVEEKEALASFSKGVALLRQARERATASL